MTTSCASLPAISRDYERIHRDWLSALPHVVKINSSFALREIIDRPNVGLA
jgi:Lrp/AsnC family leucine-responsive transcriptional regulator